MSCNALRRGSGSTALKDNSSASRKNFSRSKRMLSQAQRTTILELHSQGVGKREIARVLRVSRASVRKVLRSNSTAVPELQRPEKAEPYRQPILELFEKCKGNLVRVHEELVAGGAELSYSALTAFCRRHGIGYAPPVPAGQYEFPPGAELPARHLASRGGTGGQETQGADGFGRALLFADAVLPVLRDVPTLRLQGVSHRCAALHGRRTGPS